MEYIDGGVVSIPIVWVEDPYIYGCHKCCFYTYDVVCPVEVGQLSCSPPDGREGHFEIQHAK